MKQLNMSKNMNKSAATFILAGIGFCMGGLAPAMEAPHTLGHLQLYGESLNTLLNRLFLTPGCDWTPVFANSVDTDACIGQTPAEMHPTHCGLPCVLGPWFMAEITQDNTTTLCCIGRTPVAMHCCIVYTFRKDSHNCYRLASADVAAPFQGESIGNIYTGWIIREYWEHLPDYLKAASTFGDEK